MDKEALISAMMQKGHSRSTAEGAIAGRGMADLWREYMGGSGGGGDSAGFVSPQDYANAIVDAQKQQIDKEVSFLEKYTKDNPFVFDEEFARKSATAEYEPYYTELLQDYIQTTDLKRQNVQDEYSLLKTLKKMDDEKLTREYQQAVESANEGWAGKGMFFSGIKARNLGQGEVAYGAAQRESGERFGASSRGYERSLTGINLEESMKKRDVGRAQQESVEGGILQRQGEAQKAYYGPLEMAYYRQFPTSSGSSLRGYSLPEYYRS